MTAGTCAICTGSLATGHRLEPLGRNDAMVKVCLSCADETPVAKRGPEMAYEINEDPVSDQRMKLAIARTQKSLGVKHSRWTSVKEVAPGHVIHRVRQRPAIGPVRDRAEAEATFAREPWAKDATYLGTVAGYHVFQRPDPRPAPPLPPIADPLAAIRKFEKK